MAVDVHPGKAINQCASGDLDALQVRRAQLALRKGLGQNAVVIAAYAMMDPAGFAAATSLASYIFGGIGYVVIIAMTATSFDRTAAAIGAAAWRRLHLTGGYYLLFQFMVSFGKRIPDMPLYALFLIPLVAVFALRMISMAAKRTPRTIVAG